MDRTKAPVMQELGDPDELDTLLGSYVDEIRINPDAVLQGLGGQLKAYQPLLRDHQVKSLFGQRQDALVGFETTVEAGGTARRDRLAADALKEQIQALQWDDKTRKMAMAIHYGYGVGEFLWAKAGSLIYPEALKVRRCWNFGFGKDGELRKRTAYGRSEPMPERKFWVVAFGADDDDSPYGLGLAHHLYWPVFLKRNGAKFWSLFLDKFGTPSTVARYPNNARPEEKRTALDAARALRSLGATALPDGFDIQLVEAAGAGKGNFEAFLKYWDDAVAKLILGQSGTSTIGPYSGTAGVHNTVRMDIIRSDADLLCESFNAGPVRWLTDWNYPGAAYPKVWRRIPRVEDEKAQIERDTQLWAMGIELTDEAVLERYGEGYRRRQGAAGPQFAEAKAGKGVRPLLDPQKGSDPFSDVDVLTDQLDDLAMDAMENLIAPIRNLMHEVDTLEELRDRLLEAYPTMDSKALANLMAQAMGVACLEGMVS